MAHQQDNSTSCHNGAMPEIHEHEAHRKYKLVGRDNSEVERTAGELFEANSLLGKRNLWVTNFTASILSMRDWCEKHKQQVRLAFVDVRIDKVNVYFVPESESYDLDLGNAMTAFEIEFGATSGLGCVETLQVPFKSIDRFVGEKGRKIWDRDEERASAK